MAIFNSYVKLPEGNRNYMLINHLFNGGFLGEWMRIGNPKWENVVFKTRHAFPPGFLNGEHPNTSNSMAFDHFHNILDRNPCNDCEKPT